MNSNGEVASAGDTALNLMLKGCSAFDEQYSLKQYAGLQDPHITLAYVAVTASGPKKGSWEDV